MTVYAWIVIIYWTLGTFDGWLTALLTAATTMYCDDRSGACFGGRVVVVLLWRWAPRRSSALVLRLLPARSSSVSSGQPDEGQLGDGRLASGEGQSLGTLFLSTKEFDGEKFHRLWVSRTPFWTTDWPIFTYFYFNHCVTLPRDADVK